MAANYPIGNVYPGYAAPALWGQQAVPMPPQWMPQANAIHQPIVTQPAWTAPMTIPMGLPGQDQFVRQAPPMAPMQPASPPPAPPAKATAVKARHILVKEKGKAEEIRQRLANGESFDALAKKFSTCPSKEKGGDLGFFEPGQMVPEFDAVAFNSKPGELSAPIKTDFGWHILQVTGQKFGGTGDN